MADKTASIRVDLKADQAKAGIRGLASETNKASGEMQGALSRAFSTGLKGGVDALKGAFSTIKSTVLSIGGLAGGLGVAELARGAIEAEGIYRKIAFQIRAGSGEMVNMRDIQRETHAAALATGQASDELAKAMAHVRDETGDADFARSTIETIGTAAKGAHEPLETMANISGVMNEKFGITKDQLPAALATIVGLGNKGGVTIGEMGDKLGLIGAYAKEAGLSGEKGLGQIVGMLNLADNANGSFKKGISAVGGLLEQLSTSAGKNKIGAALGLSSKDLAGNAPQQIEAILKATKGQKAQLEKAFGGEQLKLLVDLGKTYGAAFDSTKGDVKTKTAAALDAVRSSFESASKSSLSYADLQKEAAAEMQTGEGKMKTAIEKLRQAFADPKVTSALEKMIGMLPALADGLAKLVGFAAESPITAGGLAAGGIFAKGALEAIITGALKTGGADAAGQIGKAMMGGGLPLVNALGTLGPIAAALALTAATMWAINEDNKKQKAEREGLAKQQAALLKGGTRNDKGQLERGTYGAYQVAGALENATGVEFDPNAAISDAQAAAATGSQDERDKIEAARAMARGKAGAADLVAGNRLAAKFGWNMPQVSSGVGPVSVDANAGGVSGTKATAAAPPPQDPAVVALALKNAFPPVQRVEVTNAKDIGGGGGPTGAGYTIPGWKPR